MAKKKVKEVSSMLTEIIIKGLQEKKGKSIKCIDLRSIKGAISDYFIICHGTSRTQVEALAKSVRNEVKTAIGANPYHTEGTENAEWILLDYFDVVVHIFEESRRRFYNLEGLWADAEINNIPDLE
jgi:ribosome-associated protein